MSEQTEVSEQQYNDATAQRDEAEKVIQAYWQQSISDFKARWKRFQQGEVFTDDDLCYSATVRCQQCKAGLAYPKKCDAFHQWTCSNVLKGIGTDKGHTALPFTMYDVKSENQPSANGATTRPAS